jgi:hypothetical protein
MTGKTITTAQYKLFPSPRNVHREIFSHQIFVPYPYALIDLPSFDFRGKASLYAACRLSDMKMGQVVTLELAVDAARFQERFVPD